MEKKGEGEPEEEGDNQGEDDGLRAAQVNEREGSRPVNGGLEIWNKMDVRFEVQKKIQEWAMACADEIKQEVANRRRLKEEAIYMSKKLISDEDKFKENKKKLTGKIKQ